MTSHRPYRPALGIERALEELELHKGSRFNSDVVNTCLQLYSEEGLGKLPD